MTPDSQSAPLALIVDDDAVTRQLACIALEADGWRIEEATNGREALAAFQQHHPDIVLLDVQMPEMNGYAACAALRALPDGALVPVLIMTGLDDYRSIEQAYDAGATDFITKPLNGLLLAHRVRYILRASRTLQELHTSQASLAQARDAALEGTRLKSEFLATVSHELRTPLNGVLGMTQLLLETPLTPEQQDYADTIRTSGEALLTLINDILSFSTVESGPLPLNPVDFDLPRLLEDAAAPFTSRAHSKGLTLSCLIQPELPAELHGDPAPLREILSHLLGNAVKFTTQGHIMLRAEYADAPARQDPHRADRPSTAPPVTGNTGPLITLRVSVTDTGIGIAPESCAKIFQPFVQADGSAARRYGGAGLGLALCQQLAERMGGAIGVDSTPGHGSTFYCTLPFERIPEHRPRPV